MANIDLNKVEELVKKSYIYTTVHNNYPNLMLIKYLPLLTYSNEWCETSKKCRGLVVDIQTGQIIVHSMEKFFNIDELVGSSVKGKIPVGEKFKAYNKQDGSLGQLAYYNGSPIITSSGSFHSEHADFIGELLHTKYESSLSIIKEKHQNKTFIFELESPRFRIVLDNGSEDKLVLLAIKETDSGQEFDIYSEIFSDLEFPRPEMYDIESVEGALEFQKKDLQGKEGIILLFESGFRVKLKFENYLNLHRFFTMTRLYDLWNILKDGKTMEVEFSSLISKIPDEFYQSVKQHEQMLKNEYSFLEQKINSIYNNIINNTSLLTRKEQANFIIKNHKQYSSVLFKLLDNKSPEKIIWEMLQPDKELKLF